MSDDILVGAAAEEQGSSLRLTRDRRLSGLGVLFQRLGCPAATIEAAPNVLIRATRRLHHSIQGDVLDNNELAHWSSLSLFTKVRLHLAEHWRLSRHGAAELRPAAGVHLD